MAGYILENPVHSIRAVTGQPWGGLKAEGEDHVHVDLAMVPVTKEVSPGWEDGDQAEGMLDV